MKDVIISTPNQPTNAHAFPNNPSDTANNTTLPSISVYFAKMDTKLLLTLSVLLNSALNTIFKLTSAQNAKIEPSAESHTFML